MKLLAVFALLCAVVALTSAEATEEPKEVGPAKPQAAKVDVAKRICHRHCPCGWTKINHRCFLYIASPLTWVQAEHNCVAHGGHLASVHSAWEYYYVKVMIYSKTRCYPRAWIGGNDRCSEGHWRWTDGTCFNYRGWCCGEPNNHHNQDCLQINFTGHKCWDDFHCEHRLPSVCVRPL